MRHHPVSHRRCGCCHPPFYSHEHVLAVGLREDGAAVHRDAGGDTVSNRVEHLARTEHNNAVVAPVSDALVNGRARDAGRKEKLADTHVADELARHAEHTRSLLYSATAT